MRWMLRGIDSCVMANGATLIWSHFLVVDALKQALEQQHAHNA